MSDIPEEELEAFKKIIELAAKDADQITDFNLVYLTKDGKTRTAGMNHTVEGLVKTLGLLSTVMTQLSIDVLNERSDLLQKPDSTLNSHYLSFSSE